MKLTALCAKKWLKWFMGRSTLLSSGRVKCDLWTFRSPQFQHWVPLRWMAQLATLFLNALGVEGKPNGKYMKYYERNLEWCLLNVLLKWNVHGKSHKLVDLPGESQPWYQQNAALWAKMGLCDLQLAENQRKQRGINFPISKFLKCIWWLDRSPWFPGDPRVHRSLGSKHKSKIQGHFGMEQHG